MINFKLKENANEVEIFLEIDEDGDVALKAKKNEEEITLLWIRKSGRLTISKWQKSKLESLGFVCDENGGIKMLS